MGNDVQRCLKKNKNYFIECNRLAIKKDETQLDPFQKIFGHLEPNASKEAQIVQESIVLHKQEIYHPFSTIQYAENEEQMPERSFQENQNFPQESGQQKSLKKRRWEQKFVSLACSPIRKQLEMNKENYTENTYRRLRHHYFKLKGCQPKNK